MREGGGLDTTTKSCEGRHRGVILVTRHDFARHVLFACDSCRVSLVVHVVFTRVFHVVLTRYQRVVPRVFSRAVHTFSSVHEGDIHHGHEALRCVALGNWAGVLRAVHLR